MALLPKFIVGVTCNPPTSQEVDTLAQQMHRDFRAAVKVLIEYGSAHDHGWTKCHRKGYFLRRAKRVLLSNAKSA